MRTSSSIAVKSDCSERASVSATSRPSRELQWIRLGNSRRSCKDINVNGLAFFPRKMYILYSRLVRHNLTEFSDYDIAWCMAAVCRKGQWISLTEQKSWVTGSRSEEVNYPEISRSNAEVHFYLNVEGLWRVFQNDRVIGRRRKENSTRVCWYIVRVGNNGYKQRHGWLTIG